MIRHYSRTVAALLTAAVLVAPGVALAGGGPEIAPQPTVVDTKAPEKPALAEMKVTRDEAIAAVTKLFPIPKEMNEPNVSLNQSKGGASWQVQWQTPSKQANQKSIYAGVDAITGEVISYNYNSRPTETNAELKFSRSEAYKLAAGWLHKVAPGLESSLRYTDDPLQYGFWGANAIYQFHWDRMEQGYPVYNDGVDIAIDARTGDLTQYNRNWRPDLTFTLPQTLLEQAKAEQAFHDQLPMQLNWRHFTKPGTDQGEWKLVYRPYGGFPNLSQDGALIDYNGHAIDMGKLTDLKLVPAADKPYVKPDKLMTKDEALALAQTVAGRTDTPTNINCNEWGEEKKTHTCNFDWYEEKNSTNVSVDLQAGVINGYNHWKVMDTPASKDAQAAPKYTQDDARKIAMDFLRTYRPDLAGNALLYPTNQAMGKMPSTPVSYYFSFARLKDSVVIGDANTSVDVDANTGAVSSFYSYQDEQAMKDPFPAVKETIKPEAAVDAFLKTQGVELAWVTTFPGDAMGKYMPGDGSADVKPVTALVWAPRRMMGVDTVDAATGVPYDYSGRDLIQAAQRPQDIEGYFAQREIELLWARGVLDLKDGKFGPNDQATASDLARWLVLSRGIQPYMAYDWRANFTGGMGGAGVKLENSAAAPYFGAALQAGIILPEDFDVNADPNAPVSRELFALWAVRAMGYGDLVKMDNRIEMTFTDKDQIDAKYANAAAILNGLKITTGDAAGQFNPQRAITRGEAAKILFAVASKGRGYYM